MLALAIVLQATLAIGLSGSGSSEYLPLRVADAEGYFASEGLQVTLRSFAAEGPAAEAMARGRAELAATSIDAALRLGHARGAPPRLLFGLSHAPPVALLVPAGAAGAVRELRDLAGLTVGIPAPGTPEHTHLMSLLLRAGLAPPRVTIKALGERPLIAAIESGGVAAGMIGEPWASRLVGEGKATVMVDLRQADAAARWLGGPTVHAAVFLRAGSSLGRTELIALDRALLRAQARLRDGAAGEIAARLGPRAAGPADEWPTRLAAARSAMLRDGRVSEDALRATIALVRDRSPLPASLVLPGHLGELILTSPLDDAVAPRR